MLDVLFEHQTEGHKESTHPGHPGEKCSCRARSAATFSWGTASFVCDSCVGSLGSHLVHPGSCIDGQRVSVSALLCLFVFVRLFACLPASRLFFLLCFVVC